MGCCHVLGKIWQTTMNIEISFFLKKKNSSGTILTSAAINGTIAREPALFYLNFEYKKENYYCFSVQ
jgi:hypothetical protein